MAELFADLPEALANTAVIAQRCAVAAPQAQADPAARSATTRTSSCARDARAGPRRSGSPSRSGGRPAAPIASGSTIELDVITGMGFAGYFLIVADFIKWAKAQRHPGRAGPRLGRGLGRRLGADHHRPRPDRARPAVRALPQSRARVDARLRHRLLRNPPRQGDRLRPAASTAATRSRRSSPSGRLKARAVLKDTGRVLQMPLRPGRPARQADPQPSDRSVDARALAERRLASSPPNIESDAGRQAPVRPRDEARGPAAPRLDPRRRRGDRRPAARRARPALPRSALGHAGHPVRHEICRGGGPGEVRLPRPEDAVGAQGRPAAARRAGHRGRFRRAAVGRSGGLRAAPARRHGRRVPARIRRHAADARRR